MTSIKPALLVIAAAALFPTTAMAQELVTRFRLAQAPNNIQGCIADDLGPDPCSYVHADRRPG